MIVQIFGAIDLIAAVLLYFGKIPGPGFIVSACILLLFLKGAMSMHPFPFYLPGFVMNLTDVVAAPLLYFGTTPMPEIKIVVIAVLLIKSIPSLVSGIFLLSGFLGSLRK